MALVDFMSLTERSYCSRASSSSTDSFRTSFKPLFVMWGSGGLPPVISSAALACLSLDTCVCDEIVAARSNGLYNDQLSNSKSSWNRAYVSDSKIEPPLASLISPLGTSANVISMSR